MPDTKVPPRVDTADYERAAHRRQQTTQPPSSTAEESEDFLDRLARIAASINPYSWSAALIGLACLASATLIRFVAGWASSDLRFSMRAALPAMSSSITMSRLSSPAAHSNGSVACERVAK